jgi:hypothetical protein
MTQSDYSTCVLWDMYEYDEENQECDVYDIVDMNRLSSKHVHSFGPVIDIQSILRLRHGWAMSSCHVYVLS